MRFPCFAVIALVLISTAQAQPRNDFCQDADRVDLGQTPFDTTGAITDGPVEPTCGFCCGDEQINQDVWFEYRADEDGPLNIGLCDSLFDTKLAVYQDECPTGSNELIACNDDFPLCGLQSQVTIDAQRGTTYLIRIGGFRELVGQGTLTIAPPPEPPANDECENAIEVRTGETFRGTTEGATGEDVTSCTTNDILDVWHTWRSDCTGIATASLCGDSDYDTSLGVFTACGGGELACDDDGCERQSRVDFDAFDGDEYVIRVSGFNGLSGDYGLTVSCVSNDEGACCEPDGSCSFGSQQQCDNRNGDYHPGRLCENIVCPPPNDACEDAVDIFDGVTDFTTVGATTDGPGHLDCEFAGFDQVANDIWFIYRATANGSVTVSTCNSADYDTKIAAYTGTDCPTNDERLQACNDDAEGCGLTSEITFDTQCGQEYLIRVGGFGEASGSGSVAIVPDGDCVECRDIRKFETSCRNGKLSVKVKSRLDEGVILTVDNNGDRGFMRINNRGKGKVVFRGQSGIHTVFLVECPERQAELDCG